MIYWLKPKFWKYNIFFSKCFLLNSALASYNQIQCIIYFSYLIPVLRINFLSNVHMFRNSGTRLERSLGSSLSYVLCSPTATGRKPVSRCEFLSRALIVRLAAAGRWMQDKPQVRLSWPAFASLGINPSFTIIMKTCSKLHVRAFYTAG